MCEFCLYICISLYQSVGKSAVSTAELFVLGDAGLANISYDRSGEHIERLANPSPDLSVS